MGEPARRSGGAGDGPGAVWWQKRGHGVGALAWGATHILSVLWSVRSCLCDALCGRVCGRVVVFAHASVQTLCHAAHTRSRDSGKGIRCGCMCAASVSVRVFVRVFACRIRACESSCVHACGDLRARV